MRLKEIRHAVSQRVLLAFGICVLVIVWLFE